MREKCGRQAPAYIAGTITFDFFGNDEFRFRNRALKKICKSIRTNFNISVVPNTSEEGGTERGEIAFACVALDLQSARDLAGRILDAVERESPARVINDHWIAREI